MIHFIVWFIHVHKQKIVPLAFGRRSSVFAVLSADQLTRLRSIPSITAMLRSAKPFVCCDRLEDSRTCVPIRFWNSSQI
jgi:hypothetical protein